jgi:hypothetical protein
MSRDGNPAKGPLPAWAASRSALPDEPGSKPEGRRSVGNGEATGDAWDRQVLSEEAEDMEIDPEELREFLAADLLEVKADPLFKENLRQKLWRIVRARQAQTPSDETD